MAKKNSSHRFHFSPKIKWDYLKRNQIGFFSEYENIIGDFQVDTPVGHFQLLNDNKKVIEETIFII